MSLLDELRSETTGTSGGCSVCHFITQQPNPDEWDAAFAVDKSDIPHSVIGRKMRSLGFPKRSDKPVETHRRERHRVPS